MCGVFSNYNVLYVYYFCYNYSVFMLFVIIVYKVCYLFKF